MRTQFWFELKKQPRWLYGLWFLVLLIGLGSIMLTRELNPHREGIGYTDRYGNEQIYWNGRTMASERKLLRFDIRDTLARAKKTQDGQTTSASEEGSQLNQQLLGALDRKDYLTFNRITLKMVADSQLALYLPLRVSDLRLGIQSDNFGEQAMTLRLQYMVKHRINRLITLDERGSVLSNLAEGLGFDRRIATVPYLAWLLLGITIITFAVSFSLDQRGKTSALMHAAPLNSPTIALIRGLVTLLLLNVVLLAVFACVLLVMWVIPGHEFGFWQFPLFTGAVDGPQLLLLSHALFKYWGLYNLWALTISGLVYLLRGLSQNGLLLSIVPLILVFGGPLHWLSMLPPDLAKVLPSSYTALDQIVMVTGDYANTTFGQVALLLGLWAIGLWLVGSVVTGLVHKLFVQSAG